MNRTKTGHLPLVELPTGTIELTADLVPAIRGLLRAGLSEEFLRSSVRIGAFQPFGGGRKADLVGGLRIDVHAALKLGGGELDRHAGLMTHVNSLKPRTFPLVLRVDHIRDGRVLLVMEQLRGHVTLLDKVCSEGTNKRELGHILKKAFESLRLIHGIRSGLAPTLASLPETREPFAGRLASKLAVIFNADPALVAVMDQPGDGRSAPVVPAAAMLWAILAAYVLRDGAFHAVEALVRSPARRALGIRGPFGDDTLAYFTERLEGAATRAALVTVVRQAKRRRGFDDVTRIGLVLDGTTVGRCPTVRCPWCHPVTVPHVDEAGVRGPIGLVVGQQHKLSLLSVVGGALMLPVDLEPYGPGDSEQAASLRLLQRGATALGPRFAQYVLGDGLYAAAPFLHAAGDLGLHAVVRLNANVPTLFAAAQARFVGRPPTLTLTDKGDRIELWDADDFDPWEDLRWWSVRVVRYRQHHPDGTVVEAYWLTDFSARRVSPQALYRLAKGRWTIENQGFNDSKIRYGLDHVPHHHANSLLIHWLLVALTLTLERLYRVRYLHRGTHPPLSAMQLLRRFRLTLGKPALDTG